MNAADALTEMRRRGVVLLIGADPDDGRPVLRWRAGPGIVTERTVNYLRNHKAELLALLQDEVAADAVARAARIGHAAPAEGQWHESMTPDERSS